MFRKSFLIRSKGIGMNTVKPRYHALVWWIYEWMCFANLDETVLLFRVTDDFYKNRRNGFKRAKKMLKDRFMINKALHYDWSAYIFSFLMFIMTLTPPFLKKFLYHIRWNLENSVYFYSVVVIRYICFLNILMELQVCYIRLRRRCNLIKLLWLVVVS